MGDLMPGTGGFRKVRWEGARRSKGKRGGPRVIYCYLPNDHAVFARRLRVSTRTLENWEQGRAQPNAQAAALILMVRKFPDTLEKLSELGNRAA